MSDSRVSPMPPVPKTITVKIGGQDIACPIYTPFYYASLSSMWVYYQVDPQVLQPYLEGTGFAAALFNGHALVDVDFQNYTGHGGTLLETCNEVEFNALVYPKTMAQQLPDITFEEFLAGADQSKTFGHFRLHVSADNAFAVAAGIALFGEPKFLASFTYEVPALNDPIAKEWKYACNDYAENNAPSPEIFNISADLMGLAFLPGNSSPMVEYSLLKVEGDPAPRPIGSLWNMFGMFETYSLTAATHDRVVISYGTSANPMRTAMQAIIGDAQPVAVQLFVSPPVATESRAYYVDLPVVGTLPAEISLAQPLHAEAVVTTKSAHAPVPGG